VRGLSQTIFAFTISDALSGGKTLRETTGGYVEPRAQRPSRDRSTASPLQPSSGEKNGEPEDGEGNHVRLKVRKLKVIPNLRLTSHPDRGCIGVKEIQNRLNVCPNTARNVRSHLRWWPSSMALLPVPGALTEEIPDLQGGSAFGVLFRSVGAESIRHEDEPTSSAPTKLQS
jgi:hypothetical protein